MVGSSETHPSFPHKVPGEKLLVEKSKMSENKDEKEKITVAVEKYKGTRKFYTKSYIVNTAQKP